MSSEANQTQVIDWLMQGDPSVRWQTRRDLLGEPATKWKREQQRVAEEGWGEQLLSRRDPEGTWGGGIYSPKWTSTTYTLLLLRDLGLPPENRAGADGARLAVDGLLGAIADSKFAARLADLDLCVAGIALSLLAYFKVRDGRMDALVDQILREQMSDGGWNCARCRRPDTHHGSLHTTINILEGLADYCAYRGAKIPAPVKPAMGLAQEFMLQHHLFRSDKTGRIIRSEFTKFSFPPRWHYDVLRALDYFQRINATADSRFGDAIDLLLSKRGADGCWKLGNVHRGKEFFSLERGGRPSRTNTLRALRVLRWWNETKSLQ